MTPSYTLATRPCLLRRRLARCAPALVLLTLLVSAGRPASAQTPTPTPTVTPTATPTPTPARSVVPASSSLYGIPNGGRYDSSNIVLDPDGAVWTASARENVIAKLSPDGTKSTRWTMPKDAAPSSLLRDPDGTFWLTELGGFHVANFDPATSMLKEWTDAARRPSALVKRSDGKFWLPETSGVLAQFDPATGLFTYYKTVGLASLSYPFLDLDGSLWTSDFLVGGIIKYSADATKVTRWNLPDAFAAPSKIFRAFDGNLWVSLYSSGQLARFDPVTGTLEVHTLGSGSLPFDLASYRNRIVFSEQQLGNIGFFDPATDIPSSVATLVPIDLTTTTVVATVAPTTTTLVSVTDNLATPPAVAASGSGYPGLAEIPLSIGSVYGIAIDERRARIYFGATGSVGTLLPPVPTSTQDQYFPGAASAVGRNGTRYATQVVTWNRPTPDSTGIAKAQTFTERLLPDGWIAGFSPAAAPTLNPDQLLSQLDPIAQAMAAPDSSGALRLAGAAPNDLFGWGRTYIKREDGGTYGFSHNFVKADRAINAGESGFLFAPPDAATQRTNAGLVVVEAAKGTITIVTPEGATVRSFTFDWPAGFRLQASTIFEAFELAPVASARIVFSVTSGKVLPFGTSLDSGTNDAIGLEAFGPQTAGTLQFLLGVARGAGSMGASSRTDLQLFGGAVSVNATIYFFPAADIPPAVPPAVSFRTVSVPAAQVVTLRDVLSQTLGVDSAQGSLAIVSDNPLQAFARVTAGPEGARYGYGVAGVQGGDSIPPGSRGVFLAATDNGYDVVQSDLQLTNPTYDAVVVTVKAVTGDGSVAGTLDLTLGPKEVRSIPAAWYTIAGFGTDIGRLDVVPAAGSAPVFATLLRQDRKTLDVDGLVPFVIPK